ncbi:MAG: hypothetical protein NXI16_17205 [Alphaproteobacteria bacterium]|nr:hypothetical protein [Alphaproteobacteria bacterium]
MLRPLIALLLMITPAVAWEATPGPICALTHDGRDAFVRLTYDPSIPEYSIAITVQDPWVNTARFAIRFEGPRGLAISTERHVLSPDGKTLTVTDSGFSNVLDGLEFNVTATALLGDRAVTLLLDGAAPAVRDFRACASGLSA